MSQIQNILVGVDLHHGDRLASSDLGDESRAAVTEALRLAATWESTVTFCSVLEISAQSQSLIDHDRENIFKTVEDVAGEVLSSLVSVAKSQGIASESVIRFGTAWEEIAKEAATNQYDLVIIGSRSKKTLPQPMDHSIAPSPASNKLPGLRVYHASLQAPDDAL